MVLLCIKDYPLWHLYGRMSRLWPSSFVNGLQRMSICPEDWHSVHLHWCFWLKLRQAKSFLQCLALWALLVRRLMHKEDKLHRNGDAKFSMQLHLKIKKLVNECVFVKALKLDVVLLQELTCRRVFCWARLLPSAKMRACTVRMQLLSSQAIQDIPLVKELVSLAFEVMIPSWVPASCRQWYLPML